MNSILGSRWGKTSINHFRSEFIHSSWIGVFFLGGMLWWDLSIIIVTIWITWCCKHRPLKLLNCCLDSIISILHCDFSVNQWEQQSVHFMSLFNPYLKFSWHLGKDWLGKTLVVLPGLSMVKRSLFGTSVIISEMKSLLLSFEFFSSISPDATIAALELSLVGTELAGGLDLANLILFCTCLSATSLSSLFPEGDLGGGLPFSFLWILLPIKTTELVTKLIKLQQK